MNKNMETDMDIWMISRISRIHFFCGQELWVMLASIIGLLKYCRKDSPFSNSVKLLISIAAALQEML